MSYPQPQAALVQQAETFLEMAGDLSEPAVPSRLWALLSQEKLLATIVLLHGLKLSCTVSTCPAGNLAINWLPYNSPLTKPYFDSIWSNSLIHAAAVTLALKSPPGSLKSQAGGMCGSGAWAAANRIGAALRAALCGAPATTTLSASDAAKQELVAVAVLGTATDMAIVASNEWSQLSTQGCVEPPADLLHTLLLCTQSIKTALPLVMSGPERATAGQALPVLYGVLSDVLKLSCRALGISPAGILAACSSSSSSSDSSSNTGAGAGNTRPSSGTTGSSSSASMAAPQSVHSSPSTSSSDKQSSRKGRGQKSGKGLPASSRGSAQAHSARITESRTEGRIAVPEAQSAAMAEPARASEMRGLLAGALTALHRAYFFHTAFDPSYSPDLDRLEAGGCGTLALQKLHMNQPRPITDPAPALLSNASKEAHGAGSRQHARRSAGGRGGAGSSSGAAEHPSARPKFQGSVWAADMFSLGPAPAALAAADGAAVILDSLVSNTDSLRQTHLVSCLETMLTLTKLAGAMSKEAADPAFEQRISEVPALRSWLASCGAMCKVARGFLNLLVCLITACSVDKQTLQHLRAPVQGKEEQQQQDVSSSTITGGSSSSSPEPGGVAAVTVSTQNTAPISDYRGICADSPSCSGSEATRARLRFIGEKAGSVVEMREDLLVMLPLLSAAALQLAHAALGCVRTINNKVLPSLNARAANCRQGELNDVFQAPIYFVLDMYQAQAQALALYTCLVKAAAHTHSSKTKISHSGSQDSDSLSSGLSGQGQASHMSHQCAAAAPTPPLSAPSEATQQPPTTLTPAPAAPAALGSEQPPAGTAEQLQVLADTALPSVPVAVATALEGGSLTTMLSRPPAATAGSTAPGSTVPVTGGGAPTPVCQPALERTPLLPAGGRCTVSPDQHATSSQSLDSDRQTAKTKAVTAADLAPPDFSRHCAAVAVWGSSLAAVWNLTSQVAGYLDVAISSGVTHLASWLPGSSEEAILDILEQVAWLAVKGLELDMATGGDLAGWLGDLAPRGDLTSSQLLYRLCCVYKALGDIPCQNLAPQKLRDKASGITLQTRLLLLAMARQEAPPPCSNPASATTTSTAAAAAAATLPPPSAAATAAAASPAGAKQEQGNSNQGEASHNSGPATTHVPPVPKRPKSLFAQLVVVLERSPAQLACCLGTLGRRRGSLLAAGTYVFREVERCTGLMLRLPASQLLNDPDLGARAKQELLERFLDMHQCSVWQGSWGGVYRPQEEARHAQRLKAYVQAAGRRAAQQAPAVASLLKEMLELGDSV